MATVVLDSNPAWQACLRVDDDGYLMVTGVGGGGSSRTPDQLAEKASLVVQAEAYTLLSGLKTLPSGPALAALLSNWRTTLKAKLAAQLT